MFILILIFDLIALLFTAVAASSQPSLSNRLTVVVAICAFMLALYQVDTGKFNPFVLAATLLLNLFLTAWLVALMRVRKQKRY